MNATQPQGKKDVRILIIEDEGDICFLLNLMLKKDDVEIEHVNTLAQADVFLREQTPHAVILDNKMPDGLGVDYIKTIKQLYPDMKVIMITGNSSSSDKQKALSNGADIFLPKPFTKDQIRTSLQQLLDYNFAD
jgi:two-component system, OmpR family, response regulator